MRDGHAWGRTGDREFAPRHEAGKHGGRRASLWALGPSAACMPTSRGTHACARGCSKAHCISVMGDMDAGSSTQCHMHLRARCSIKCNPVRALREDGPFKRATVSRTQASPGLTRACTWYCAVRRTLQLEHGTIMHKLMGAFLAEPTGRADRQSERLGAVTSRCHSCVRPPSAAQSNRAQHCTKAGEDAQNFARETLSFAQRGCTSSAALKLPTSFQTFVELGA